MPLTKTTTKMTLDTPREINVKLIRADTLETSDTFRVFFEISLSIASTVAGYILSSSSKTPNIAIIFLICAITSAGFSLYHSMKYRRNGMDSSPDKESDN
ncbi:MAG: hypothetical protein HWE39_12840 [Oceanospirillaceae bacterium]|nr:hypothetical protein [Oceanospirillaceae bacterium]